MRYVALAFLLSFTSGCASNTGTGFLAGVTVGASAGGLIGGGSGSLIGTFAGAVTGSLLGTIFDEQDRKIIQNTSPRTVERIDKEEPLTLSDIIKLTQGGVSDHAIIHYMIQTKSVYDLTAPQKKRLFDSGVSPKVIHFMIEKTIQKH